MIALVNTTWDNRESILFQPIRKAYPTWHSWMITVHVSLGNMEKQWKLFTTQMIRTCQLLPSLLWHPAAPTQLLSGLGEEFSSLNSIYTSYQPLIQVATQLLQRDPTFDGIPVSSKCMKRSLLPFLGDTLSWLTGTATTKDVNTIKSRINHLISTQQQQQETLVHIISILSVTRYATQVNRQHINILMDAMEKTHQDITTLYKYHVFSLQQHQLPSNHTTHQIHLGQPLGFITIHVRNSPSHHGLYQCGHYRNTLTTYSTCPGSVENAEVHWGYTLFHDAPANLLLETLHFYRYLCTHILITDEQFLLLIDVPIQDRT